MPNRIQEFRKKAQLSQEGLCEACGWSPSQSRISKYEAGERVPGLADMRKMVAAFNTHGADCTLDDVFPPESDVA
jgi:putative transcriptional regulator